MRPQVLCFLETYVQLVFVEFDVDFLVLLRPYDPRAVNLKIFVDNWFKNL